MTRPLHAGLAVVMAAAQAAATDVKLPEAVTTFLGRHCDDCHRGADAEAAFDVATLTLDAASPAGDRRWATLLDRVADGEMSPTDADQPTAAERKDSPANGTSGTDFQLMSGS